MENLLNIDNMDFDFQDKADLIYCDYVYENDNFDWADKYWEYLKKGGVFVIQTDYHTVYKIWQFMQDVIDAKFLCHSVWKNEFGNFPKDMFHQCFDDILFFTNDEKSYKFYPERIQVPKATAKTKLNPSGRQTKTATAWIDDICLTTTSKERVKKSDGHLVRWQKPLALYSRIIASFYGRKRFNT